MRNKIFAAVLAAGALLLPAFAQNYKVVVTTNDDVRTEFTTESLSDIKFGEAPEYAEANELLSAVYTSKGDLGIYTIVVATAKPDAYGYPPEVTDAELTLELVGAAAENYMEAQLPEGYYRLGAGTKPGEFNVERSALILRLAEGEGDEGTQTYPFINGVVDVRYNGGKYVVKAEMTLFSGETVNLSYTGPINFTPGSTEAEAFTEDQNVTFTGAQARLYSNWAYPFVSDVSVELYSGEFNDKGKQLEGYWMHIDMFMPKLEDPATSNPRLADGVYTVEPREVVSSYTNIPYTYTRGGTVDFWGQILIVGTYLNKCEKSGRSYRGSIAGGTITISNNGGKIVLDLVTDNGKKITSTYEGNILIENRYDPEKVPDLSGNLDHDVTLKFVPETAGVSYAVGDYIKKDLNTFMVMITDPNLKKGHYLSFELCCESETLADGTYTINDALLPFTGFCGTLDPGGNLLFSWYSDLESPASEGYEHEMAPIKGGTLTITTTGENNRKVVCDLVDDKGNKITGTYEGYFLDVAQGEYDAPRKMLKLKK